MVYWHITYLFTFIQWAFGDFTLQGNIGHKIDMMILGAQHLYQGEGQPFDQKES